MDQTLQAGKTACSTAMTWVSVKIRGSPQGWVPRKTKRTTEAILFCGRGSPKTTHANEHGTIPTSQRSHFWSETCQPHPPRQLPPSFKLSNRKQETTKLPCPNLVGVLELCQSFQHKARNTAGNRMTRRTAMCLLL